MEVGESGYNNGDGDVFGRSYVCARMEVQTLTRQKGIYSTLTRQKDIYSCPKKDFDPRRQKDIYSTLTRQKDIYSCPKKDFVPPKGHLLYIDPPKGHLLVRVPKKTLTRQKDIYSTLTRQKDIYSCPKKTTSAREVFFGGEAVIAWIFFR